MIFCFEFPGFCQLRILCFPWLRVFQNSLPLTILQFIFVWLLCTGAYYECVYEPPELYLSLLLLSFIIYSKISPCLVEFYEWILLTLLCGAFKLRRRFSTAFKQTALILDERAPIASVSFFRCMVGNGFFKYVVANEQVYVPQDMTRWIFQHEMEPTQK